MLFASVAQAQQQRAGCSAVEAVGTWNNCVGTFTYPTGDKYIGEVRDGKPDGQGTVTYANGDKYVPDTSVKTLSPTLSDLMRNVCEGTLEPSART